MKIKFYFYASYMVSSFIDDFRAYVVPGKSGWVGTYGDLETAQQRAAEHAGRPLEWTFKQGDFQRSVWSATYPVPNSDGGNDEAKYAIHLVDRVIFEPDELRIIE